MSRDTNKNKNIQRRSALSFIGGDDTIDDYIDHLMQSQSWRNTDEIENSDIGLIQKVLNEFDEKVTQEKKLKMAKARSRKKSTGKSTTEDSTAPPSNSEASSSNSNTSVFKSKIETKEKTTSTKQDRKPSARKSLQPSIDDTKKAVRKTSESSANEIADNESIRKTNMKEATITIGKEIATDNLMTSSSEASSSNMHSNTSVSKSKVETKEKTTSTKRDRKPSARKSLQPSIDDTKKAVRKTSESSVNEIADNESIRKTNMKEATIMIDQEIATDNLMTSSSEASSSNMHSNTSVSKSKVETKEKATSTKRDRKSSARKSLQPSTDDTKKAVRKTSESSANEIADNESIRKTNMKEATIMIDKEIATDNLMTSNFEGSSSNIHSNTSVPKVETREKKTLTKRASKAIKKTSPRENLQHNTDDTKKAVRRASDSSVKEIAVNESLRKKILKEVPTNTSDIKLLTSTPKTSSTRKGTVKDKKSIVEKGELKMTNSENKPKEHVKRKKKQSTKTLKKDIEYRQGKYNTVGDYTFLVNFYKHLFFSFFF